MEKEITFLHTHTCVQFRERLPTLNLNSILYLCLHSIQVQVTSLFFILGYVCLAIIVAPKIIFFFFFFLLSSESLRSACDEFPLGALRLKTILLLDQRSAHEVPP